MCLCCGEALNASFVFERRVTTLPCPKHRRGLRVRSPMAAPLCSKALGLGLFAAVRTCRSSAGSLGLHGMSHLLCGHGPSSEGCNAGCSFIRFQHSAQDAFPQFALRARPLIENVIRCHLGNTLMTLRTVRRSQILQQRPRPIPMLTSPSSKPSRTYFTRAHSVH